jgi:hypothetical protein
MAGKGAAKRRKKRIRAGATTPLIFSLKTVSEALNSFETLIKAFSENRIKRQKYTGLVYGLNSYACLLRLSKELEIEGRLRLLEEKIK